MSTEDDMIDKMGITHDGTKVHRMPQLHKTCRAVGSPPATFTCMAIPVVMLTLSLRSFAGITTGYSDGRPPGVYLAHSWFHAGYLDDTPPGVNLGYSCLHTGYPDGRPSGFVEIKKESASFNQETPSTFKTHTRLSHIYIIIILSTSSVLLYYRLQRNKKSLNHKSQTIPLRDKQANHVDKPAKNQDKSTEPKHMKQAGNFKIFVNKSKKL